MEVEVVVAWRSLVYEPARGIVRGTRERRVPPFRTGRFSRVTLHSRHLPMTVTRMAIVAVDWSTFVVDSVVWLQPWQWTV